MKLTKCVNGHFYDEEKFEGCPHCAGGSKLDVNAIFGGAPSAPKPAMSKVERDDDMTVPLEWTPAEAPVAEASTVESVSPAVETVSPAAEMPATETVSPVAAEMPATEAVSPVAVEMPATETVSGNVEQVVDIQSQPSFDTPLDFDAGFTRGEETVDEDGPTEEPEEEFELLSKFHSDQVDAEESEGSIEPFVVPEPEVAAEPEPFAVPEPEAAAEPEPFAVPEPEAAAEPEPFVAPEPGPFVAPESEAVAERSSYETPGAGPFVAPESEAAAEPGPFVAPESEAVAERSSFETPGPFVAPEPEAVAERSSYETPGPGPFVAPESEAVAEQSSFETPGPGPFVAPEPEAVAERSSYETPEPGPFVAPETVQAPWKMPQPNVEEIPTGDSPNVSAAVDPELEDKPTEIVDEVEMELVNGIKKAPSPAAAMFGASVDDDDDEHTVAFYDEIFVSKAPAAPVVPEAEVPAPAAPIPGTPVAPAAPVSESVARTPGDVARVPEPDVFTAPPLQPAQLLPTPCVGWLIALNGSHIGQDFHLRVGKNYIGRDAGMDIVLSGDKSVSRNKHAIVIYEPKHHKYFIQPGESNELVYVNDEVVLLPMPLKAYDIIVIGDIELWFMPLCDDQHNWSEVIRKLQEHM